MKPLLMWILICWGLVYAPGQALACLVVINLSCWHRGWIVMRHLHRSLPRTKHGHQLTDC